MQQIAEWYEPRDPQEEIRLIESLVVEGGELILHRGGYAHKGAPRQKLTPEQVCDWLRLRFGGNRDAT